MTHPVAPADLRAAPVAPAGPTTRLLLPQPVGEVRTSDPRPVADRLRLPRVASSA